MLSTIFNDHSQVNWDTHLPRMYNFWNSVLLYKGDYKGSPFQKHANLPINKEHFNEWLSLFNKNLDEKFEGKMTEEAKVILDGKELEVKDFSDQQKYLYNQIVDLKNKQGRLNFELDQINASLSVFENAFKESFKEEPEEAKTEEK